MCPIILVSKPQGYGLQRSTEGIAWDWGGGYYYQVE